jgi:hypothetical protein
MKTSLTKTIAIAIAIVIITAVIYYQVIGLIAGRSLADRGSFGDSFGALNTFFTALAFLGLVFSIILQRRELDMTKADLELTREELKKQNATLAQQRFENTFFNMIQIHSEKLRVIRFNNVVGRDAFLAFYNQLKAQWNNLPEDKRTNLQATLESYVMVFRGVEHEFGHYFRNLYHIVRLIKDSEEAIDKKKYARIVRAQLSSFEIILIFYNCLTPYGKKFQPLIEEYGLFKNFNEELLWAGNADKLAYNKSAFGESKT